MSEKRRTIKPINEFTQAEIQALREKTRKLAIRRVEQMVEKQVMDRLQGKPLPPRLPIRLL